MAEADERRARLRDLLDPIVAPAFWEEWKPLADLLGIKVHWVKEIPSHASRVFAGSTHFERGHLYLEMCRVDCLVHEFGHYIVAPPADRRKRNYGHDALERRYARRNWRTKLSRTREIEACKVQFYMLWAAGAFPAYMQRLVMDYSLDFEKWTSLCREGRELLVRYAPEVLGYFCKAYGTPRQIPPDQTVQLPPSDHVYSYHHDLHRLWHMLLVEKAVTSGSHFQIVLGKLRETRKFLSHEERLDLDHELLVLEGSTVTA